MGLTFNQGDVSSLGAALSIGDIPPRGESTDVPIFVTENHLQDGILLASVRVFDTDRIRTFNQHS